MKYTLFSIRLKKAMKRRVILYDVYRELPYAARKWQRLGETGLGAAYGS